MNFQPYSDFRFAFRKGDEGNDVAVLQLNLPDLIVDGRFGRETQAAVKEWQRKHNLVVDGVAGIATQQSIITEVSRPPSRNNSIPAGLLKSIAFNESSFILANAAPHAGDDGFDVGAFARSSGSEPGSPDFYASAFSASASAEWTAGNLRAKRDTLTDPVESRYFTELAGGDRAKFRWQLAVLSHNWPGNPDTGFGGAQGICNHGRASSDDDADADWIVEATKGGLRTPRQWCMAYIAKATVFARWRPQQKEAE